MSYDVSIGCFDDNYTSNMSGLFYSHIDGGLLSLDGLTGRAASALLDCFWQSVHSEYVRLWDGTTPGAVAFCAKYDSKNGWGSTVGALIFMAKITSACSANPRHKLRVSS